MSVIAGLSLSIFRACSTRRGQVPYSGIGARESSGHLLRTGRSALFRDIGRDTSTRCYLFVCILGCVLGGLITQTLRGRLAWASRGNPGHPGFVPSRRPRPNDRAAQLYCRVQPRSAAPTRTPSNQTSGSSFARAVGAGRAPTPRSGTPFINGYRARAGFRFEGGRSFLAVLG